MTGVFIKRGSVDTDMHFGGKWKATIKVVLLQARAPPTAREPPGAGTQEAQNRFSLKALRRNPSHQQPPEL